MDGKPVTGGHLVAAAIAREGVRHVFCVPGESYLGVLDGLLNHPQIQLISARQESGAGFMAEAYAKASGRVGVCMATRGVGAANLAIALHTARQDSTPVVAFLGQVEQAFQDREAFQEVALDEWFRPLCKWTVEIRDVARIPELVARAFFVAESGRPGPVVVSLPHDIVHQAVPATDGSSVRGRASVPAPTPEAVHAVHEALLGAERPVMIVGGGVLRARASAAAADIADLYRIPAVTAFRRFDAFPNEHPCYAGWLGLGPRQDLIQAVRQADCVVAVGTRLSQVTSQDYQLVSPDARLFAIDVDPLALGSGHIQGEVVVADAARFLEALRAVALADPAVSHVAATRTDWTEGLHAAYLSHSTPRVSSGFGSEPAGDGGEPSASTRAVPAQPVERYVDMDQLMADFNRLVPDDAILTTDAGNFHSWLVRYHRFSDAGTYIGPTSGAMGYGLPAALSAALVHPDRPIISFSGDGGFLMTLFELETACRYHLRFVSIVVNNHLYGTIRAHQERMFPGRVAGTELGNPDFAAVAQAFGGYGVRVTDNRAFPAAFSKALQADKFTVIEVVTDPSILSAAQSRRA
ncbi:MAG: acetolactate synthase [Alicyclobacillus sp.]|nr:acetolactate synthase [Alicyclobacillus sp.]